MTVLSIIRDCLDALLHPSARYDALTRARHRAFMAPRLLGSLVALAAFPIYLAMRGAPSALEVAAFAWLIAPILLSWFLSRTGRYEGAHMLSSLALAGLVMMVAHGHRRHRILCRGLAGRDSARGRAVGLAPRGRVCLRAGDVLRRAVDRARAFRPAAGCRISARRCAASLIGVRRRLGDPLCRRTCVRRRIAGAHQRVAALCRGRPLSPAGAQHERRDFAPQPQRRGAVHLARGRSHAGHAGRAARSATACSTASMSPTARPISPRCRMPRAAARRAASSSGCGATPSAARTIPPISSGSRCVAGRSSRPQPRPRSSR